MADALHFTGNQEADVLLAQEPLALLIGFALDQQVPVQTAFSGPLKLKQRFGTLDARKLVSRVGSVSVVPTEHITPSKITMLASSAMFATIPATR